MAKDKPRSYGQFDQGAGQKYASKGKKKATPKPRAKSSSSSNPPTRGRTVRHKSEDEVRADMRQHRRDVLRGVVEKITRGSY